MNDKPTAPIAGRRIAIAVVFGLTLLSGVLHGYLDGRWSSQTDLNAIGARLANLPERSGDWVRTSTFELDESAARMLQCHGSEVRGYTNEKTGVRVSAFVLFGPRGPMAVHTPEICYRSIGTRVGERRKESISNVTSRHEFWSVQFARNPDPQPTEEVWYAWTDGDRWQARENPRYWLTHNLHKIQVAGPIGNETQPCRDFLESFLPDLEEIVN